MRRYNIYYKGRKNGKTAAALGYTGADPAPRLIAKGRDGEAERIIALARDAGIAVVEDPALAALLDLSAIPGDYIPPKCWEAAARILALVLSKEAG
jgi:flagellar biosynthesis protein